MTLVVQIEENKNKQKKIWLSEHLTKKKKKKNEICCRYQQFRIGQATEETLTYKERHWQLFKMFN